MTYPLTYLYLVSFAVGLSIAVAVGVAAPPQPAKRTLVLGMFAVSLWALASFITNLAETPEQMVVIGNIFAPTWSVIPFVGLLSARQYARRKTWPGPLWLDLLLALPMLFALGLEWSDRVTTDYIPAALNGGAFDLVPTGWQLAINVYFLIYSSAAGILMWRVGVISNTRRVHRTALFFLALVLPAVLIGSWSSGGLSLTQWRPPFLDAIIACAITATLGWGMLRDLYFKPRASLEAARHAAETRLENLLRVSPDCLGVVDLDGFFRVMNLPAAQILGYESVEACLADRKPIDAFIAPEDRHRMEALRAAALTGTVQRGVPLPLSLPNGDRVETEISVSLLRTANGAPQGFVASLRDVSARRRLEEGMRQAQKLESLGLLASGIAHDFNNLLSVVLGSADLALTSAAGNEAAMHNIRQTIRGAKHLSALTRELLVYSGKARQVVGPLSFSKLVEEIGGLLEVSLPRDVTLETALKKDLPLVTGDGTQLQQVILNLITNAAEASAETGGVVSLRTSLLQVEAPGLHDAGSGQPVPPGRYLCLEVRDRGPGVPTDLREKIFDPFFTSKVAGRGLGLSVVLGIVRDHGGFTLLDSTPGHGTTFRVLLPPASAGDAARTPFPFREAAQGPAMPGG